MDSVPLTHDKIFKIGAVFKAGGYRSFNNYVEAVKEIHLKDFEWTTMLARSARNAVRAATRGIGPAKQACGFDLFAVAALPPDESSCVPNGHVGKTRSWGCTCNAEYKTPCPFHSGVERHRTLLERFAANRVLPIDMPYFPTATGHVASKESVVKTFEHWP